MDPKLTKSNLALYGALVLLLAWSVDNLIVSRINATTQAISEVDAALAEQNREASLDRKFLGLAQSMSGLQRMMMIDQSRSRPLYSPQVLTLLERQAIYERHYWELFGAAKRLSAAKDTVKDSMVDADKMSSLKLYAQRLEELKSTAERLQGALSRQAQKLLQTAFSGGEYSSRDDKETAGALLGYEKQMVPVLSEYRKIENEADSTLKSMVDALQERRSRLQFWSSIIKWFYVCIFLVGTSVTILAKRS